MNSFRVIAWIVFGLLLAASLVVAYRQPSAENVARRHCTEQGVAVEKLSMLSYRSSQRPVWSLATVEFQVLGANPPKKLVVNMRQPAYFLSWQVLECREEEL